MRVKGQRSKLRKALKIIGIAIVVGIGTSLIGGTIAYIKVKPLMDNAKEEAYNRLSTIDEDTFILAEDTEIFDKDNNKIGEINITNFKYAKINNISKYIQNGYIAVEDTNFKTHNGIDYSALMRAGIALIKNKGEITQGGSTITQQVLKNNVIGTDINKWERKLIEFFLAPEFEKMFTKSEVMEFYCNSNYYANGCYGVETASQYYFGKSAKDISLSEAAVLVGISNNPSAYNPVTNYEASMEKRDFVLSRMYEEGYITEAEYNQAKSEEIELILEKDERVKESYLVSYAIHCATLELMKQDNFNFKYTFTDKETYDEYTNTYNKVYKEVSNNIRYGGYDIYTTFDMDKQQELQTIVDNTLSGFTEQAEDGRYTMQGSATLVDNSTGNIIALVGGRGTEDEFNRAYQGYRQPGSSIKPLVVYAPAFETGEYYPSLELNDKYIKDGPKNATGSYRGYTSIREAIARSINTIPYNILQEIGPSTGARYLGSMKFSKLSYLDTYNGSLAVGGFTYGVTTSEMAKAYATLVNKGEYINNNCLRSIVYKGEEEIYNSSNTSEIQIFSEDTAYMILDCLKDVIYSDYGTGKAMKVDGQIVAGKTGTTNDNKDAWFCGVTDYYSLAVWCGYDTPREIPNIGAGTYPGKIFVDMMTYLHKDLAEKDFEKPDTIIERDIDNSGNPVDYNTGRVDIFSGYLEQKKLEEQKKQAELEEQQAKEAELKAEEEKIEGIRSQIIEFGKYSIKNMDNLDDYDYTYNNIKKQINTIKDNGIKKECLNELNAYYDTINSLEIVIQLREDKKAEEERKEQERLEQERIAREKAEAEAKLKLERLQKADEALSNLVYWTEETFNKLSGTALSALQECEGYSEYTILREKYNEIKVEYDTYIANKNKNNTNTIEQEDTSKETNENTNKVDNTTKIEENIYGDMIITEE